MPLRGFRRVVRDRPVGMRGHPFVVGRVGERRGVKPSHFVAGSTSAWWSRCSRLRIGSRGRRRRRSLPRKACGATGCVSRVARGRSGTRVCRSPAVDLCHCAGGLPTATFGTTRCSTIQPKTHPDGGTAGQKSRCRPSTGHRPLRAAGRRGSLLVCVSRATNWYARHVPKNAASGRGRLERRDGSGEG